MTNSKVFLKSSLKRIFLELDNIEVAYEFRLSSNTHIVEVKPNSVYTDCKKYINKEIELEEAFNKNFPNEELLFITENSLTQIKTPEFIFKLKLKYDLASLITPIFLTNSQSKNAITGKPSYALAA